MSLKIDSQITDKYPNVLVGVVVARNLDNTGSDDSIMHEIKVAENDLPQKFQDTSINEHELISCWRDAYRSFGAKPKKYPSSIANLSKRVLGGYNLPHINKLVDIYNSVSLKYLLPVGGEDLDKIQGNINLTIASDNEVPVKLLGEKDERPPYPDEVIYKDELGTVCRRWNWKEADRTRLTEETKNAVLVIEALPPADEDFLSSALTELEKMVQKHTSATTSSKILTKSNSLFEF